MKTVDTVDSGALCRRSSKAIAWACAGVGAGVLLLATGEAIAQQAATKAVPVEGTKAKVASKLEVKKAGAEKKQGIAAAKAARVVRANEDAQINMLMAQWTPQFRQILRAEFQVMRVVCEPNPEQSKTIARLVEKSLKEAVRKYADGMRRPMNVEQRLALDPHKLIQELVLQAILTQLSTEQAGRYHQELAERAEYRKQLSIRNLVTRLDRELVLDSVQREKLEDSLRLNWSNSWSQSPNTLVYDYAFLPNIPEQAVGPLLNETQKKVWRGIPKNNGFFNQFLSEQPPGGELIEDPYLRAARLAEAAEGERDGK